MKKGKPEIKGYRQLTQVEIDLINQIKAKGEELEELLIEIDAYTVADNEQYGSPDAEPRRWMAIGKTHLQQGLMALTRSIARPESF